MFHVIISTQCFPPEIGGIETYMGDIACQLHGAGYTVCVFADRNRNDSNEPAFQFSIRRFGGPRPIRKLLKALAIWQYINRYPDTVVLADSWKSAEALSVLKSPVVIYAHGNELLFEQIDSKFDRIRKIFKRGRLIIANSDFTRKLVSKFDVPDQRIIVFNIPIVEPQKASPEARINVEKICRDHEPIFTTIARLERRKGIDSMIKLMPKILSKYPRAKYVIAGQGDCLDQLKNLTSTLQLDHSVQFMGRVNSETKTALLERADLFVMPTRLEPGSVEGYGISFIEAAWFGVPAVATNVGGAPDAILHNETGLICEPDDEDDLYAKLDQLLSDKMLYERISLSAQDRAKNQLSWNMNIHRLVRILSSINLLGLSR